MTVNAIARNGINNTSIVTAYPNISRARITVIHNSESAQNGWKRFV
jgi:hypothetical protein